MFDEFQNLLVRKFQLPPDAVTRTATLEDLELDSLDVVEIRLLVEKEFGVQVTEDEIGELAKLSAIVDHIEAKRAGS